MFPPKNGSNGLRANFQIAWNRLLKSSTSVKIFVSLAVGIFFKRDTWKKQKRDRKRMYIKRYAFITRVSLKIFRGRRVRVELFIAKFFAQLQFFRVTRRNSSERCCKINDTLMYCVEYTSFIINFQQSNFYRVTNLFLRKRKKKKGKEKRN